VRNGFYVEYEYSINEILPLAVRDDMPFVYRIEHLETLCCAPGARWECGKFTCDAGTVEVSEIGVRHEAFIVADSVGNFNATVQALKNGELKPAGSEQTLFQDMIQKVLKLEKELALSYECQASLSKEVSDAQGLLAERIQFLHRIDTFLRLNGEVPTSLEDSEVSERIVSSLSHLRNRTFWQRLWNL
jgi:hypothetical protein